MKFNIVIPTRNPEKGNNNFEFILNSNIPLNKLIIIDDSTINASSTMLKKLALNHKERIVLLSKSNIKKTKIPLKLGVSKWNLGNARSLGMLASLAYSEGSNATIFFDDDIYPIEETFKFMKNRLKENYLGKINIQGSPDLSRLEWIELYLKIKSPESEIRNDYIEEIYKLCKHKTENIIKNYTDLLPEFKDEVVLFPQREELSGGAFFCCNSLLERGLFSNWFDEDWLWFENCRKTYNARVINSGFKIFHKSKIKSILIRKQLIFEEKGKIMTALLKDYSSINLRDKIEEIISKRVRLINKIYDDFDNLNNKNSLDRKIIKELIDLSLKVKNIDRKDLLKKIKEFKEKNELYLNNEIIYAKKLKEVLK